MRSGFFCKSSARPESDLQVLQVERGGLQTVLQVLQTVVQGSADRLASFASGSAGVCKRLTILASRLRGRKAAGRFCKRRAGVCGGS